MELPFLTVYLAYKNKDVQEIYQLINPGYIDDKKQEVFESWHKEYGVQLKWFGQSEKNKNLHDERSLPTECGGTSETF